jgi:1-acyl-sn-glycerol-3-phosphate acyltransferase
MCYHLATAAHSILRHQMNQHYDHTIENPSNVINNISRNQGDSERVAFFLGKKFLRDVIRQMNYQFGYFVSYIFQVICWPMFYIFYHTFFDLTINGKEKLKDINEPIIFISNHISSYDSFVFDLFVSPFSRIQPFRFIGTTQVTHWYLKLFKYTGILYLVYLLFGVIKVTYGKGAEIATIPAADIIERGGTVAIFPEGKIWMNKTDSSPIGPFKWGAAILARNTNALVVPVSFKKSKSGLGRIKLVVNIGEAYKINLFDRPEVVTEEMRNKVLELYNK